MLLAPVFATPVLPLVVDPIALVFGFVVTLVAVRLMLADLM
jgi:hypothetical protein